MVEEMIKRAYKEGPDWRIAEPGKRCRGPVGQHKSCGRSAAVELKRKLHRTDLRKVFDVWWPYCELHSYGHIVRNGEVWYVLSGN